MESKVTDHSGMEAVSNIAEKFLALEKDLKLIHLSPECKMLLLKAHPNLESIIETSVEDPRYHVVTDMMDEEV
jgi:SulP family sulfate permease